MRPSSVGARTSAVGVLILLLSAAIVAIAQSRPNQTWQELDRRAEQLYVQGTFAEAIATARLALDAATTPAERGQSLGRLGFLLHADAQSGEAEKHLRASLQIRDETFGGDSLEYAQAAHDLAVLARDTGRLEEAAQLAARAVAIRRRLPPTDPRLPQALDTHGSALAVAGNYAAAITLFEEAMVMHEANPPAARAMAEYGVLGVNLAGTYHRMGKYQLAEQTMAKARDALRIRPGTTHLAYIGSTVTLASMNSDSARFSEAESLFDEAIGLLSAHYRTHPYYAVALNNRGSMYRALGNFELAEKDLRLALELKLKTSPRVSVDVATALGNLGQVVYRRDRGEGESLLREAAANLTAAAKAAPPYEHVNVLLGLGRAERHRQALRESETTLQQALVASERLGLRHPLRAAVVREIGLSQQAAGELDRAETFLVEALRMAEDAHGREHPDLLPTLRALARVHEARGDAAAALVIHRRSFDLEDKFLNDVFAIGSEAFKETILDSLTDPVDALIGFQSRMGDAMPAARTLAFEAATRRKGRVLEHLRHRWQWLRTSPTAATTSIVDQLDAIVRCRTSLMLALGDRTIRPRILGGCGFEKIGVAARYERLLSDLRTRWTDTLATEAVQAIAALEEREQSLETALARVTGPSESAREVITAARVAASLQSDELLIELSAYLDVESRDTDRANPTRKYGAFVLGRDGELSWLSLGEAASIERAVGDLLKAANDWTVSTRNREAQAAKASESTAIRALAEITRRVWAPLEGPILRKANIRRLRIAPDSALNLVPFEALGLDAGSVIDRFSIAYLPAGRDLLRVPASFPHTPPVVVVSDGRVVTPGATPVRQMFPGLPNAAAEGRELTALLRAELKTANAASEQAVKALRSPFIVHLVGHGRVGDDACLGKPCEPQRRSTSAAMARSVMVFQEAYGAVAGSREDGFLTAAELQQIDLRGTAMLVLSQCQMASGLPSVGEGIYGMRRAAAVAGVQTFVAPLWNVDDQVHRNLMRKFYEGVVAGRDRATALREAKLNIKAAAATRNFLNWAPVILSGEIAPLLSTSPGR